MLRQPERRGRFILITSGRFKDVPGEARWRLAGVPNGAGSEVIMLTVLKEISVMRRHTRLKSTWRQQCWRHHGDGIEWIGLARKYQLMFQTDALD